MKQFKARVEPPQTPGCALPEIHAMEIWFRARNIFAAVVALEELLRRVNLDGDAVTRLIEVEG